MRPRVNLLPVRYIERAVERRRAGATAAGLLALLLVLGIVAAGQVRELRTVEEQRDLEQALTAQLQARRAELAPFRDLADRVRNEQQLLAAAMDSEVSWAGVLASLSATFPTDASLTAFRGESILPVFAGDLAVQPGDQDTPIGSVAFNGYSVDGFAPGVAETLRLLTGVSGVSHPRLATGALGDIGETPVTTFDGLGLLDAAAMTGRYIDGLAPEDRIDVPPLGGGGAGSGAAAPDPASGETE